MFQCMSDNFNQHRTSFNDTHMYITVTVVIHDFVISKVMKHKFKDFLGLFTP